MQRCQMVLLAQLVQIQPSRTRSKLEIENVPRTVHIPSLSSVALASHVGNVPFVVGLVGLAKRQQELALRPNFLDL